MFLLSQNTKKCKCKLKTSPDPEATGWQPSNKRNLIKHQENIGWYSVLTKQTVVLMIVNKQKRLK